MAVSREFGLEGYLLYDRPINSEEFCQIFDLIDRQGIVVDQHLHEELVDDERIQSIIGANDVWLNQIWILMADFLAVWVIHRGR
jgi:hypothetical protein